MPTCVAFTTLVALLPLASRVGGTSGYWLLGWGVFNLLTTYGLGVFDGRLSRSERPPDDVFPPEGQFLILQIIFVPFLFFVGYLILAVILSVAP